LHVWHPVFGLVVDFLVLGGWATAADRWVNLTSGLEKGEVMLLFRELWWLDFSFLCTFTEMAIKMEEIL
jgi:hypothetical protein